VKVGDLVKHRHYSDLRVGIVTRKPNHMFSEVFWGGPLKSRFDERRGGSGLEHDVELEVVCENW